MNLLKYMVNRQWKAKVDGQLILDKKIAGQKTIYEEQMPVALFGVFAALCCIVPGTLVFIAGEDKTPLIGYILFVWYSVYLYNNRFLKVIENGKKVNVFNKYAYVPVDRAVLIGAKIVRLTKRCILYILIFQGVNLLARMIWASVANYTITWSILNLWPAAVIALVYLMEYVRIRICAMKIL